MSLFTLEQGTERCETKVVIVTHIDSFGC